jgi:hypothetical protein
MKRKAAGFLTRLFVPPFRLKRPPSKQVAIVVPLSNRPDLLPDEEVSLRHLRHFLGRYDKFLVAPPESEVRIEGFESKDFPARFFGSVAAHNRLLGSPAFYRAFLDYEYIFFYHLDALAFSDQLEDWCSNGLDYIGPPWILCDDYPWLRRPRVGNGGFTLLRVSSALKVLTNRYREEPSTYWLEKFTDSAPGWLIRGLEWIQRRFPGVGPVNRLMREWSAMKDPTYHGRNNDLFWSDKAVRYLPEFKVASLEEGLRFGFEASPRTCFEMNGGTMPFGCHAWGRYDRAFWEPYLLKADQS